MNKPGILLEVVQVLTDLDLIITKAYISSDGGWFMDGMSMLLLTSPVFFFLNGYARAVLFISSYAS
jgi:hypothetical protein